MWGVGGIIPLTDKRQTYVSHQVLVPWGEASAGLLTDGVNMLYEVIRSFKLPVADLTDDLPTKVIEYTPLEHTGRGKRR